MYNFILLSEQYGQHEEQSKIHHFKMTIQFSQHHILKSPSLSRILRCLCIIYKFLPGVRSLSVHAVLFHRSVYSCSKITPFELYRLCSKFFVVLVFFVVSFNVSFGYCFLVAFTLFSLDNHLWFVFFFYLNLSIQ